MSELQTIRNHEEIGMKHMVKKQNRELTTHFFKEDLLIFRVSDAPSNNGSTLSTSSFFMKRKRSSSSICLIHATEETVRQFHNKQSSQKHSNYQSSKYSHLVQGLATFIKIREAAFLASHSLVISLSFCSPPSSSTLSSSAFEIVVNPEPLIT